MNQSLSITIHDLGPERTKAIRAFAKEHDLSLNKTIKKLLDQALNLTKSKKNHDFSRFCGVWTEEEAQEFEKNIAEFEKIDWNDWQQ